MSVPAVFIIPWAIVTAVRAATAAAAALAIVAAIHPAFKAENEEQLVEPRYVTQGEETLAATIATRLELRGHALQWDHNNRQFFALPKEEQPDQEQDSDGSNELDAARHYRRITRQMTAVEAAANRCPRGRLYRVNKHASFIALRASCYHGTKPAG